MADEKKAAKDQPVVRELVKSKVVTADSTDPDIGWTVQHGFSRPEVEPVPGQVVKKSELPCAEGLKEVGVVDVEAYLANVPVE